MKYLYPLIAGLLLAQLATSQDLTDQVVTGPGYAMEVWYSAENGEVQSSPHDNWDLAFQISGFASSIRINGAAGVKLYAAPYAADEWAQIDTAGMASLWPQLHNDPGSWEKGAFNRSTTSEVDLGWGIYNFVTHHVNGDSTYVIQLADGAFRKLRIDHLISGTYTFTHADLDGSNEVTSQLVKSDFSGKNFGYYRFADQATIDREPLSSDWDLVFTRWIDFIGPDGDTPYGVTGVLHNLGLRSSRAQGIPVDEAGPWDQPFEAAIHTIGWDWKSFDFATGFVIEEDLSFFFESQNGSIYHLVFTGFEGSSTGVYAFGLNEASALSTSDMQSNTSLVYPNPARSGQEVRLDAGGDPITHLRIFDLSGKMVASATPQAAQTEAVLPTAHLPNGTYLIHAEGAQGGHVHKLILTP